MGRAACKYLTSCDPHPVTIILTSRMKAKAMDNSLQYVDDLQMWGVLLPLCFTEGISTESGDSKHCCPATWSGLKPQDDLEVPTLMPRSKYMGLMGY